ncbi:twin-arginine translocation signal domain-containing protein [Streptomyces sp. NBC_01022]|uniref:twin-arginine translocation signal domain-containing protein n=1 Tax=Streptomyces sp. NBC_01022 TaxID=2903723 RepID=UPI003FA3B338
MGRKVTRRDFIDGVAATAVGAAAAMALPGAAQAAPSAGHGPTHHGHGKPVTPYPPGVNGLRGQQPGSYDVAHAVRDGAFAPGRISDTRETYDLVVVGGDPSGLAAAHLYRKHAARGPGSSSSTPSTPSADMPDATSSTSAALSSCPRRHRQHRHPEHLVARRPRPAHQRPRRRPEGTGSHGQGRRVRTVLPAQRHPVQLRALGQGPAGHPRIGRVLGVVRHQAADERGEPGRTGPSPHDG